MSNGRKQYTVGQGKPPEHTRFPKGQSGNPKGRPKGRLDFDTEIEEVLSANVTVKENGKPRKVSARKAILMRLRELGLNGNPRAIDRVLVLAAQLAMAREAKHAERALSANDEAILDRFTQSLTQKPDTRLEGDENDE
jgi:hypothetical protein